MPKPSVIDASTLLATKGAASVPTEATQRGQGTHRKLVDLNFKVPPEFKDEFMQLAWEAGKLKNVQLLARAITAFKREQGIS